MFGSPTWASVVALSTDERGGQTRRSVDAIEHSFDPPGAVLPDAIKEFVPRSALQLDIDYVYPPQKNLHHGPLRTFIREKWEAFQVDLQNLSAKVNESNRGDAG
jgi:hypothetical protein